MLFCFFHECESSLALGKRLQETRTDCMIPPTASAQHCAHSCAHQMLWVKTLSLASHPRATVTLLVGWPCSSDKGKPSLDRQALLKDARQQAGKFGRTSTLIGDKVNFPFAHSWLWYRVCKLVGLWAKCGPPATSVRVDSHLLLTSYNINYLLSFKKWKVPHKKSGFL